MQESSRVLQVRIYRAGPLHCPMAAGQTPLSPAVVAPPSCWDRSQNWEAPRTANTARQLFFSGGDNASVLDRRCKSGCRKTHTFSSPATLPTSLLSLAAHRCLGPQYLHDIGHSAHSFVSRVCFYWSVVSLVLIKMFLREKVQ